MQLFALIALFSLAIAMPTQQEITQLIARSDSSSWCPAGLYGNPVCCSSGVLGAASLDCAVPTESNGSLKDICAKGGKQAMCCVIFVADQGVLCQPALPN